MYKEAVEFDSLYRSLQKVKRGVSWKDTTARYAANGLKETLKLHEELTDGSYKIRPYHTFMVTDPKERAVMATNIRDRQFQRSLCDAGLYRELTKGFIRDNFACQTGRGMDDALDRMDAHLHRYYRKHGNDGWVLKCDIHHYFAEVPHDVAKAAVDKRVSDKRAVEAVCQIIDSFGGDRGIGLGSQISQLIALSVLDDLDHFAKERLHIKHYLRYMDDFILIDESKERLQECLAVIREMLGRIGLTLNKKTVIYPLKQGVMWLKWRFVLKDGGRVVRLISKKNVARMRRKIRRMKNIGLPREVAYQSVKSWEGSARRGDTRSVVNGMWHYFAEIFGDTG